VPKSLVNHATLNLGLAQDRRAEPLSVQLPTGTVVVSADTHISLAEDIFVDQFPTSRRDQAPRVCYDPANRIYQFKLNEQTVIPGPAFPFICTHERRRGAYDIPSRLADMDIEGVQKEIAFPQLISFMQYHPDFDVRELTFQIYNRYLAELESRAPGRFYGVGMFPNYWDPQRARDHVDELRSLGLKTFRLPIQPGRAPDGSEINFMSPAFGPFWSALEEAGLPVCFHIGEGVNFASPAGLAVMMMVNLSGFRRTLSELIFGGVFDRHPTLRVVFAEGQLNWVPGALQDAELLYDSYSTLIAPRPRHRPSHYWYEHCYATFMSDAVGLSQLDWIGADRVMWSTDYPHNEGTVGYTSSAMRAVLDATTDTDARKILGGTAQEVFGLS
jgi:predicted TIM-barrel fold metal-dependent hydrolase